MTELGPDGYLRPVLLIKVLDEELYPELMGREQSKQHPGDAGLDLKAREQTTIWAGASAKLPLGVAVQIPQGFVGWLTGRSTTALKLGLLSHEGKIDSGYRGEIHFFGTALGSPVLIERGMRICQLVAVRIEAPHWTVTDELGATERGLDGLGSTGVV